MTGWLSNAPGRLAEAVRRVPQYRITSHWRLRGSADEVAALVQDAEDWARWWPATYLSVRWLPDADLPTARVHAKGWFPYTLRFDVRVARCDRERVGTLLVRGDADGRLDGTLVDTGDGHVSITIDWHITIRKPLLLGLSYLAKPLLRANHRWAMRQGERSLQIELDRRHGRICGPPPSPTFPYRPTGSLVAALWRATAGILAAPRARGREASW